MCVSELRVLSVRKRRFGVLIQYEDVSGHEENPTGRGGGKGQAEKGGIGRVLVMGKAVCKKYKYSSPLDKF